MLRQAGLRVTDYRLQLLSLLHEADEALAADDLFDRMKAIDAEGADRVTVYRTLASLVDSGLAHKVDPGDRRYRYRLTDHSRCSHEHHMHEHPHLVCDTCHRVECLEDAEIIIRHHGEAGGPSSGGASGRAKSSRPQARPLIKQQAVTLHGLCSKCNSEG